MEGGAYRSLKLKQMIMRKTFYRVQFSNALPSRDFQSKTKAIKYAENKTAGHTFVAHIFKWDMDGNYNLLYTI